MFDMYNVTVKVPFDNYDKEHYPIDLNSLLYYAFNRMSS